MAPNAKSVDPKNLHTVMAFLHEEEDGHILKIKDGTKRRKQILVGTLKAHLTG